MNMKRLAFLVLVLGVIAFAAAKGPMLLPVAHAGAAIDNGSVSGSYTIEFEGSDPVINSTQAAVGLANFDGAGNITGSFTNVHRQPVPIPGTTADTTIQTGTFTGTYNVNPDGTATVNFTETVTLNPGNVQGTNTVTLVAGFSGDFKRFKSSRPETAGETATVRLATICRRSSLVDAARRSRDNRDSA